MKYNGKEIMSFFMKGDSAFDIYKKHHPEFTGTEEEWIETITPQKGVASWTEEDKAEIKADVEAMVGDIDGVLDAIIAIQESLIGGASE